MKQTYLFFLNNLKFLAGNFIKWNRWEWWENEKQMDENFRSIWLEDGRDRQKYVRQPPKNHEAGALAKRRHPKKNWLKCNIIRIKIRYGM